MTYSEIKPSFQLQNIIDCYWEFTDINFNISSSTKVIPDNRTDFIFIKEFQNLSLCGSMTDYIVSSKKEIFGIRFRPEFLFGLIKIPLSEFTDKIIDADLLYKDSTALKSIMASSTNLKSLAIGLDKYFLNRVQDIKMNELVYETARLIEKGSKLKEIKLKTGISNQHLGRLFHKHIGLSPKKFEKIARFQRMKNSLNVADNNFSDLAVQFGYYDQSHLINECNEITGSTPYQFFY